MAEQKLDRVDAHERTLNSISFRAVVSEFLPP